MKDRKRASWSFLGARVKVKSSGLSSGGEVGQRSTGPGTATTSTVIHGQRSRTSVAHRRHEPWHQAQSTSTIRDERGDPAQIPRRWDRGGRPRGRGGQADRPCARRRLRTASSDQRNAVPVSDIARVSLRHLVAESTDCNSPATGIYTYLDVPSTFFRYLCISRFSLGPTL